MGENINRTITDNPDSIEIGTPGKGGVVKIYGDFLGVDAFKKKIENAKQVRQFAQEQLGVAP